jgi:hypothetical protein
MIADDLIEACISTSDPPMDGFAVANKTNRIFDFGHCLVRLKLSREQ